METMREYLLNYTYVDPSLKACFNPTVIHFTILMIILIVALGLAAWKARKWVRPIGRIAMTLDAFLLLVGFRQLCDCAQFFGGSDGDWCNGFIGQGMLPFFCVAILGVIIYIISLIISIAQKPRI